MPHQEPPHQYRGVRYNVIEAADPPGWRYLVKDEKLHINEYGPAKTQDDAHTLARFVIDEKLDGKRT